MRTDLAVTPSARGNFAGDTLPGMRATPGDWVSLLDGAAALVNLAGRTVDV